MELPTVTVNDLLSFHSEHLPYTSLPAFGLETEPGEVDDVLGYYPDGAKRTLTSEEVAIFRHSEIQDLIKFYNNETAHEESSTTSSTKAVEAGNVNGLQSHKILASQDPQSQGQEPSRVKRHSNSEVKSTSKDGEFQRISKKGQKRKREGQPMRKSAKEPEEFMEDGESRTYRRICREMDEQKSENVELDY